MWKPWNLKTKVVAQVGDRFIVTRREEKGVVFYISQKFGRQLEEVGKVGFDRTDRSTTFEEQLEIVCARAIQRARVQANRDAGLV